ncbi:MAG: alpha-L-arabinofuranosidase [Scytonema sp. PMC 1069.18]|nr:alpha-L-arabinofuranosidase [Scytonema sp. PMC 1069.18]MEC4879934.1 alpha-L-arabinofuranosidase [Scytonema sp. PMC 1070.18]
MRRRDMLRLAATSAGTLTLLETASCAAAKKSALANIQVDWETSHGQTTPFLFGSNDYEITIPERATDRGFHKRLEELNIRLIRVHHAELCDRWTNPITKTWDETKIKTGYSALYPKQPTIIQNISGWTKWMGQNKDGLLDVSECDRYAAFCANLVKIITQRQGLQQVVYWEPFNEKDMAYQKAGKLDELWRIYNKAAMAMKAANPQIKVGGPALTWGDTRKLASFLRTCRANVDFISWHGYATGNPSESTELLMSKTPNYANQVREFRKVAKQYIPNRKVPLLLGEYNINYTWNSGETRQNTHIGAVWFASVLKHLADAGVDMATSWHLKDGIYGMIDPQNNLRPAAMVFAWGVRYLTGWLMYAQSDRASVEVMAVKQGDGRRSLLLINKSHEVTQVRVSSNQQNTASRILVDYLDSHGVRAETLVPELLKRKSLVLRPYSLALLRF